MLRIDVSDDNVELHFSAPDSVLVAVLEGRGWATGVYKNAVSATIANIIDQYPPFTYDRVETVHHEPVRDGNQSLHSHVKMTFDECQAELIKAGARWLSWMMIYTSELARGLQEHAPKAKNASD